MSSRHRRHVLYIDLVIPVIFVVLSATAIPIEFRPLGSAKIDFNFDDAFDIVINILGYVPLGIVLGGLGPLRAILIASLISTFAEASQLLMLHRDPTFADIASNTVGAALGSLAGTYWGTRSPALQVNRLTSSFAALLAVALVLYARASSGVPISARGVTTVGTLEADWKLHERDGRTVRDSSGHELSGQFRKEPKRIAQATGSVATFDGTNYVDFGSSTALRLEGSMTISAWINSSSYPFDDAAIVSQLHGRRGYQLDTTIDRGPRTIGFKLSDTCGELMARYGTTPLAPNTWYHVAGVYDAAAHTLNVYLNGELDNGPLLGSVSNAQRSSRGTVYVGRRGDSAAHNFSGSIDRIRIYSFALTKSQTAADMRGEFIHAPSLRSPSRSFSCTQLSDPEDKELPVVAAVLGMLVAVACIGAWPAPLKLIVPGASYAAGLLLVAGTASNLPAFNAWILPLVALAGGITIVVSVRPDEAVDPTG
jgi:hypothetical protein